MTATYYVREKRGSNFQAIYRTFGKSLHTYVRNIAQGNLQNVIANKIKHMQDCIDIPGLPFL